MGRQIYGPEFEERVFFHYSRGVTCKPMLDRLIPEFPEFELSYSKLAAYIEHRQDELTIKRQEYMRHLAETRVTDAEETARRIHALEQSSLVTLEQELERCRVAIKEWQPWDREHAMISTTITRIIKDIEKLGRTALMRDVEKATAVTAAKEAQKGQGRIDPLERAAIGDGGVV